MKKWTVVLGVLSVISSATVALADITIGVNISTTGPAASLGIPQKNVLELAPKTIAGQRVRYVIYDDATDTTTAVQNVKRLISDDKVDLIIGPSTTPTTLSVVDVATEAKTPMLSLASASPIVSPPEKRKWIFKVTANDEITAAAMVNHMVKNKVKTVSIIATDDPYGEANTKEFMKLAGKSGIKTLSVEKFKKSDTSATAQILKVMSGRPDAVYIVAAGTPSAMPHVGLIERGYKGRVYQSHGAANSEFLKVGGKALEGAFLPCSPVLVAEQLPKWFPNRSESIKFARAYEGKFGPRSTFASHMWDALRILELTIPKALKAGKPGTPQFREALRNAIEETKGYKGAYAVFNMTPANHSGVDVTGIAMLKIEHGKWKLDDFYSRGK
ncbi:MAG: ABC transporter substrate-binding protein [Deltaproteobacteria bacterium]|nr:ABC transporter substrate-binding protein [Deltaproteobacteria bacterium]